MSQLTSRAEIFREMLAQNDILLDCAKFVVQIAKTPIENIDIDYMQKVAVLHVKAMEDVGMFPKKGK